MGKLIDCDENIRKFFLQTYYKKNRVPLLLTNLHIIKAQNAPDLTQNIYTYL